MMPPPWPPGAWPRCSPSHAPPGRPPHRPASPASHPFFELSLINEHAASIRVQPWDALAPTKLEALTALSSARP